MKRTSQTCSEGSAGSSFESVSTKRKERDVTLKTANVATLLIIVGAAVFIFLRWAFDTPTVAVQSTWTAAGTVGVLVTGWNLRDTLEERRAVVVSGTNGMRLFLATDYVRVEVVRLCQMLAVVGLGIYVLSSEPAISAAQRKALHIPEWTRASIIATAVLLFIVGGTVVQALMDQRQRRIVRAATNGKGT